MYSVQHPFAPAQRYYAKIVLGDGQTFTDWDGANDIRSFTLESAANAGEDLGIGCACAAGLQLVMAEGPNLENQSLQLFLGQAFDGAVEWLPMGTFTVTQTEVNEGLLTVTAHDAMYFLGGPYTPSTAVRGNCTAQQALNDVCAQAGISFSGEVPAVGLEGVPVGYSYGAMLGFLAAVCGCNARFDRNGQLVFHWYADCGMSLSPDDFYAGGLSVKSSNFIVQVLMAEVEKTVETDNQDGTHDQTTSTQTLTRQIAGGTMGVKTVNPLFTETNIDTAWNAIKSFSYRPATLQAPGLAALDPGDIITVSDATGKQYTVPVMSHILEYDGGLRSTIQAVGQSEAEQNAAFSGQLGGRVTAIEADLANFREVTAERLRAQQIVVGALEDEVHSISDPVKSLSLNLSSEFQGIPCAADGSIATFPPCAAIVSVQFGSTVVTGQCTFSFACENCTGNWDETTFTYTITSLSADNGSVTVTADYQGTAVQKSFVLAKLYQGADGEQGSSGSSGQDGVVYTVLSSVSTMTKNISNTALTPSSVTFSVYSRVGSTDQSPYSGYLYVEYSYDGGSSWVNGSAYSSSSVSVSPQILRSGAELTGVRASLYPDNTQSALLARTSVSVILDDAAIKALLCVENNRTYIDGSKIYTGSVTASQIAAYTITASELASNSVTADKINVSDLNALGATIGGWTIGSSGIYNGTSSMTSTTRGTYIGTSGIRQYAGSYQYINLSDGTLDAYGASLYNASIVTATLQNAVVNETIWFHYSGSTYRAIDITSRGLSIYGNVEIPSGALGVAGNIGNGFSKITASGEGNLTVGGTLTVNNGLTSQGIRVPQVQRAATSITPSAANTPTGKAVTFSTPFSNSPAVVATPYTTVPHVITGCSTSSASRTGTTIYITRTNTTAITVYYVAVF